MKRRTIPRRVALLIGLCMLLLNASSAFSPVLEAAPLVAAPTGLKAVAGDRRVTLTWNANPETNIWYYKIYIALGAAGPFSWIDSVLAPGTIYVKTGLLNGVTYYFKISAVTTAPAVESPMTAAVAAKPIGTGVRPPYPTGLYAAGADAKVLLRWNPQPNVFYYKIYISWDGTPANPYSWVDSVGAPQTTYTKLNLWNNHVYFFKISAVGTNGLESLLSSGAAARAGATTPTAPIGVTASASGCTFTVNWTPNPTLQYIWWYRIYEHYKNPGFSWVDSVAAPKTTWSYTAHNLAAGVKMNLWFQVRAVTAGGLESASSKTPPYVTVTGPCP